MRSRLGWSPLLFALLSLVSCAGPAQLARTSQRQLQAGEPMAAYETARRGVDKHPQDVPLQRAMTAAAIGTVADWEQRIRMATQTDTVAAAHQSLLLRDFLAELDTYRIEVPGDSALTYEMTRLRDAAAGIEYDRGAEAFSQHRPKAAYASFRSAAEIVAGYRDVQTRMQQAHAAAVTRVAIVPFANDTDVRNLSKGFADALYGQLADHVRPPEFQFTKLADPDEIYAAMTVKELEALTHDEAVRIGRGVEADRVVMGRVHGMRANSAFRSFDRSIYRKTVERDSSGQERTHYVETRFGGVSRERWVIVHCDFEVLDARTGEVVAHREESFQANARVVWTDFHPQGDCSAYCLVPPDARRDDPVHAKDVEDSWRECFGDWRLADLLEGANKEERRASYQPGDRGEFRHPSHDHPVLLGELPSEDDLVYLALEGAWEQVMGTLQELDRSD